MEVICRLLRDSFDPLEKHPMLGHMCCQNALHDDLAASQLLALSHLFKAIVLLSVKQEEEGCGVMVLQHCLVIVESGQPRATLHHKYIAQSGVVHVVSSCAHQLE